MSTTEQAATPYNPGEQLLDPAAPVTRLDQGAITIDDDIVEYWETAARDLDWDTPWTTVLDWSDAPRARWFDGGTLNAAANCLDRHVDAGRGEVIAYHWIGEDPNDTRDITYRELLDEVCKAANYLTTLGLRTGDRAAIYLPGIPEAVITMLACARLGIIHTVVFGGFSAPALRQRLIDSGARIVITSDGQFRSGKALALKTIVDDALSTPAEDEDGELHVESVLVVKRTGQDTPMKEGRDFWWHDVVDPQSTTHRYRPMPAENPLFLLYTSGTTGKPKGVIHSTGGYLVGALSTMLSSFDFVTADRRVNLTKDIYWCTADIGWITGHTYAVYGPLLTGTTSVMYEGVYNYPTFHRHFEIIEKYGVTVYYTSPTLVRSLAGQGHQIPESHDLSNLRLLGTVGEPIGEKAWHWFRDHIGDGTTPVVDTWWQTETGSHAIRPRWRYKPLKAGSAQQPVSGIAVAIVDEQGEEVPNGEEGFLVITHPWPSMLRGVWGDEGRFYRAYFKQFAHKGYYVTGDRAKRDEDGDIWILGRADDVINVAGHRLSTAEIESVIGSAYDVAETAVIGVPDESKGEIVVAYVVVRGRSHHLLEDQEAAEKLAADLRESVSQQISPIAKPARVYFVGDLPRTRSGKIMRRVVRALETDKPLGDLSTLVDPGIVDHIRDERTNRGAF